MASNYLSRFHILCWPKKKIQLLETPLNAFLMSQLCPLSLAFHCLRLQEYGVSVVAGFHFMLYSQLSDEARKRKHRQKGVRLRLHSNSLEGPDQSSQQWGFPRGPAQPCTGDFFWGLLLFREYRFSHSPMGPIFAYTSYSWKLGCCFLIINLLLDSETPYAKVCQLGAADKCC